MIDVIVIGAGLAGLSAATRLAEQGRRVLVLEARPALGGRAASFTDSETGERVDNGQHVLIGAYHETFRFLRRIGTERSVYVQPRLSVDMIERGGRASRLECPPLPAPLHLLAGALTWKALSWRDRRSLLRLAPAVTNHGGPRRTGLEMTVREWLQANGQTPRVIELLWEPLGVAALNEPIDVAAAGPFVTVLSRMFRGRSSDASLGLPLVPLDDLYCQPACRYVEARGGKVRTGVTARVAVEDGRATVYVSGEVVPAPTIVCAAPWFALPDVLGGCATLADVVAAARATPASAIVTVNLWLDRPVTAGTFVGLPGRRMQWVFDKRVLFGEAASHLSLVSSGASDLVSHSNEALIEIALAELRGAIPAARAASVRRAVVVRERRATFSVAPGLPSRPSTRTAIANLLLAGDWIETGLPATIESAVVSGHRAADAAIRP